MPGWRDAEHRSPESGHSRRGHSERHKGVTMRFVKWRGVGLAFALMSAMVVGLYATPKADAGGLYHWWNGHTINGRATLAKDYRTGGVYYAPPIPYGEYTKNYTACLHEAAGAVHGVIGKVCGFCRGVGCKVCGYLGCLHGMICGGCNGKGCGSCGGNGLTNTGSCSGCGGRGCSACGGQGLAGGPGAGGAGAGSHWGHGHNNAGGNGLNHGHQGVAYVGPGGLTSPNAGYIGNGNGLGDPTCGLCGKGQGGSPIVATPRNAVAVAGKAMPSAQTQPSAQSAVRACSLCGGHGRIGSDLCGGCGGQGKIFGFMSGVKCGPCGGNGRTGSGLCDSCGGAGLLSGLKCGTCSGRGLGANGNGCGTCGGKGLLAGAGQCATNAAHGAAACGACAGSGLINGARCAVCNGTGLLAKAVHHVASSASRAVHHVASTAHGMAQKAMWKAGKGGVEYFVGPGGPVPITPGYVNWVNPFRSPRDFFAFPPYVDQAFNNTSYSTPLYQEPARSATVVTPAPVERDRVRASAPFPNQNGNVDVNVPPPPAPGGFQREVVAPGNGRNVPPPPSVDDNDDDSSSR